MSSACITQWNLIRIMLYSALAATIYCTCTKPLNLEYAVPNADADTYEEDSNVVYNCSSGYIYIPPLNNVSTCKNGVWSGFPDVFCRKLDCGIPDILENGEVIFIDTVFTSSASYKCMEGYKLFGSDTSYCLADGKWNQTARLCNRTCPEIPHLQLAEINSTSSISDGYYPQSFTVVYTCNIGYTPIISLPSHTTCQGDFTWSEIIEFCEKVSCGLLPTVENGNILMDDDKFKSRASFTCNDGYKLVGDKYRECMEDKKWSGSNPTCTRSCPDPPIPPYADVIDLPELQYFPVGIYIIYKCHVGYKYDPFLLPSIQCLEGFKWSISAEFCKKVICGEPERIKNGNVQTNGNDFGSIASYTCITGFNLTGNAQRKCTADGVWENSPPLCVNNLKPV